MVGLSLDAPEAYAYELSYPVLALCAIMEFAVPLARCVLDSKLLALVRFQRS